jgi:phage gp36-like protein
MWFSLQDIIDEYGSEDLPLNDLNTNNIDKTEKNLKSAEMLVRGYLEKALVFDFDDNGIEIPLAQNQIDFIREPVLTIARYFYSDKTTGEDSIIVKRYESSVSMLRRISNGEITFPKNPLIQESKNNLFFNINIIRS